MGKNIEKEEKKEKKRTKRRKGRKGRNRRKERETGEDGWSPEQPRDVVGKSAIVQIIGNGIGVASFWKT